MRVLTARYQIEGGSPHMLPLCEVALLGPNGRMPVRVMIDSGAVYSVFPRKAAEDAGIRLPGSPNHQTQFGGSVTPGWRHPVDIELQGHRWRMEIVFVEHIAYSYALLGRRGVFARFNEVVFIEKSPTPRVELRW